jgi:hypothetical protein
MTNEQVLLALNGRSDAPELNSHLAGKVVGGCDVVVATPSGWAQEQRTI